MIDEILQKLGLKFDDLSAAERETLLSWTKALESNQLTVGMVKEYVHSLRDSVEQEVVKVNHNSKEDLFLKARLRNLMLLEAFLTSPEKAKQALDRALAGMVSSRK